MLQDPAGRLVRDRAKRPQAERIRAWQPPESGPRSHRRRWLTHRSRQARCSTPWTCPTGSGPPCTGIRARPASVTGTQRSGPERGRPARSGLGVDGGGAELGGWERSQGHQVIRGARPLPNVGSAGACLGCKVAMSGLDCTVSVLTSFPSVGGGVPVAGPLVETDPATGELLRTAVVRRRCWRPRRACLTSRGPRRRPWTCWP